MDRDSRLWRALDHLADTVAVGVMTLVTCLLLVTTAPAVAAATSVLADDGAGGGLLARYAKALRARLRRGLAISTVVLLATGVAVLDVLWALSEPLDPLRTGVLAAGVLLLLTAWAVGSLATVQLAAAPGGALEAHAAPGSATAWVRASAVTAAASPLRSLLLVVTAWTSLTACVLLPVVSPLVLGLLARCAGRLPAGPAHDSPVLAAAALRA
ncbi:hypothetical protein [Quadrisphaera setariae]|uniref:DUF624 domain-containing protein n=1 Tax=Quadrisphaera setariae TaxID=2593304 RepID=A0A5C8Z1B9_9ACTN|nr:hypothetical protein [Quadrisphaera setariae]TXR51307.1 hypothetical protein FMM08_22500 [Quadrisphaera setariae]